MGKTNFIYTIGFLGIQRCYLNISEEEACARYIEEEMDEDNRPVGISDKEWIVDEGYRVDKIFLDEYDSFYVYDIWEVY